eukprot:8235324-Pyramimonas_sp.AAC.1
MEQITTIHCTAVTMHRRSPLPTIPQDQHHTSTNYDTTALAQVVQAQAIVSHEARTRADSNWRRPA